MTVDQIRQFVTQILGEQIPLRGFVHSVNWVVDRVQSRGQWSFLEKEGSLAFVDEYSTGTVSMTQGSAAVTGSGTTFTSGMVGRQIRIGNSGEYSITGYTSGTSITVDRAWATDSVTGETYAIYQSRFSLASDVQDVIGMWDVTNQLQFDVATPRAMKTLNIRTTSGASFARRIAATFGVDSSNNPYLHVDPRPTAAADIVYWYTRVPTEVTGPGSTPDIPSKLHRMIAQGVLARHAQNNRLPEWHLQKADFQEMLDEQWAQDRPLQISQQLMRADSYQDARLLIDNRFRPLVAI